MVSERGLTGADEKPETDAGDDRSDRLDAAQCADFCVRPADRTEHEQEEYHEEQTLSDARDEDDRRRRRRGAGSEGPRARPAGALSAGSVT